MQIIHHFYFPCVQQGKQPGSVLSGMSLMFRIAKNKHFIWKQHWKSVLCSLCLTKESPFPVCMIMHWRKGKAMLLALRKKDEKSWFGH